MYKVYSDSYLIHSNTVDALKISNAHLDLEINKTGAFEFTIYPEHPYYGVIQKLKSIITVYQDDFLLFRGRVLNIEIGFYDEKQVVCEGQLAFLLDSIQKPMTYSGTISGLLYALISAHNSQVDQIHTFTLENANMGQIEGFSVEDYSTTWDVISKLIEEHGGYIQVKDGRIEYLEEINLLSNQKIEFAKNLLDMKRKEKGEDVYTVLYPLGAKLKDAEGNDTSERLTIKSVNEDEYIYSDSVSEFGKIVKFQVWDDVTDATELLKRAKAHMASMSQIDTLELTAADLNGIEDVSSFHIGTYVTVTSKPHGINQRFLVNKLSIDINDPTSNKLTLGGKVESFTQHQVHAIKNVVKGADGKDGKDAVVLRIDSSRGTVFKNNEIKTTLTVAIYYGEQRITNKSELSGAFGSGAYLEWSWQKMNENTFGVISASDSRIKDDGFTFELTPSDIDTKATFMCNLNI